MATKRRSLSERNTQAITRAAEAPKRDQTARRPTTGAADGLARISAWLSREEYDAARGAYLAAFSAEDVDTFSQWVTQAVKAFARLDAAERAEALARRERGGEAVGGSPRNVVVAPEAIEAMTQAMKSDQQAGQWSSKSAWFATALVHAAETTRAATGGDLPDPPARLPFRRSR